MSDETLDKKLISRRSLLNATGTTLVLGAVSSDASGQEPAQRPAQTFSCRQLPPTGDAKPKAKSLDFLSEEGFRNAKLDGNRGFNIRLRVAYYRSLPIDQILDFSVAVDGKEIRQEDITFLLEGHRYKVPELSGQKHVYWQTREYATLFVRAENGLSAGEHDVEVRMKKKGNMLPPELSVDAGKKRMTLEEVEFV